MIPTLITQRRIEARIKCQLTKGSLDRAIEACEADPNEANRDAVIAGIDKVEWALWELEEWDCETEGLI